MRMRLAHRVQLPSVGLDHDDACTACLGGDVPQRLIHIALGNVNLVDRPACAQRLDHGVAAFNQIFPVFR